MSLKTLFFLIFILCLDSNLYSFHGLDKHSYTFVYQDDKDIFDNEKLEEYKSDEDYNYSVEESQTGWWTDFKEWLLIQWQKLFGEDYSPESLWYKLFQILPYIIVGIAIVVLVWFIARSNPGNQIMRQHQASKVTLTEEEELLMKRNLNKLADEAIANAEFTLAVRYMYLNCIKRLDIKNIVRYANDKTNFEYIKEIQFSELSKSFKNLTIAYEQVWYGQMVFDETYFQQLKTQYDNFQQQLDQKQYAKV